MRIGVAVLLLAVGTLGVRAQGQEAWFRAARKGDVAALRGMLEAGANIDAQDSYGQTALTVCIQADRKEAARFLLERGADVHIRESFHHATPLSVSLWSRRFDITTLLLKHGAEPREDAFLTAAREELVDLARAAMEAGPFYESALTLWRANPDWFSPPFLEMLEKARSRPDPKPPTLTEKELRRFVGDFEGFYSDTKGKTTLVDGALHVSIDGAAPVRLKPVDVRAFRDASGKLTLNFVGRAGAIEGFSLTREDGQSDLLRHNVAEPIPDAARLAVRRFEQKEKVEPVVNWPGFRGPNRAGIGDGPALPDAWNLASGKNVRWQAKLEGLGNSSPVVWGDRVFITTAVPLGLDAELVVGNTGNDIGVLDDAVHSWRVLAFDKNTGRRLWETEVGRGKPLTRRHAKATQANSTPVTDGRRIVAAFPTAGMACLDMDGKILWRHEMGGLNASAFNDPDLQWGFAASPILYESSVILQVDVYEDKHIAAWDLASGKQIWRTERQTATSWSTPAIFPTDKGDELVVNGSTIFGYNPKTGAELWRLGPNSELAVAAPVVGDGVVYVSAGYPPVKPIYAVRAGMRGAHEVDPGEDHKDLLWSHRRGGAYLPTPLLYRGLLFIVHYNGRLVVYDPKTGAPLHKARFSKGGTFTASPVAANGKLYIATEEGDLYVLSAEPGFEELAVHDFDEPLMATPAFSEGTLLIRTPSRLIAIGHDPDAKGGE